MDKPIQAGDLVMRVKPAPCCGTTSKLGIPMRVKALYQGSRKPCCVYGAVAPMEAAALLEDGAAPSLWRLKRIPPSEELGIVDEREELHA